MRTALYKWSQLLLLLLLLLWLVVRSDVIWCDICRRRVLRRAVMLDWLQTIVVRCRHGWRLTFFWTLGRLALRRCMVLSLLLLMVYRLRELSDLQEQYSLMLFQMAGPVQRHASCLHVRLFLQSRRWNSVRCSTSLAACASLSGEDYAPETVLLFDFPDFLVHFPADSWSSNSMTGSFDDDDDDDGWRAVSLPTTMTPELKLDNLLDARKSAVELSGEGKSHLRENYTRKYWQTSLFSLNERNRNGVAKSSHGFIRQLDHWPDCSNNIHNSKRMNAFVFKFFADCTQTPYYICTPALPQLHPGPLSYSFLPHSSQTKSSNFISKFDLLSLTCPYTSHRLQFLLV